MGETYMGISSPRDARGDYHTWQAAARQYDFPVTVRRIGDEKQSAETFNR